MGILNGIREQKSFLTSICDHFYVKQCVYRKMESKVNSTHFHSQSLLTLKWSRDMGKDLWGNNNMNGEEECEWEKLTKKKEGVFPDARGKNCPFLKDR